MNMYFCVVDQYQIDIHMDGEQVEQYTPPDVATQKYSDTTSEQPVHSFENLQKGENSYRLEDLAYTRSGDKGNNANIGKNKFQKNSFILLFVPTRRYWFYSVSISMLKYGNVFMTKPFLKTHYIVLRDPNHNLLEGMSNISNALKLYFFEMHFKLF